MVCGCPNLNLLLCPSKILINFGNDINFTLKVRLHNILKGEQHKEAGKYVFCLLLRKHYD